MRHAIWGAALVLGLTVLAFPVLHSKETGKEEMFAHMVYFTLKEPTDRGKEELVEACHRYLSGIEGTVFYAAGTLAQDAKRDVNVRDFDVALQLVFDGKQSHDKYQVHPKHEEFVAKFRDKMKTIRVFDAYVSRK